ncbi:hypothetical protein PRIPAC_86363 [Pristionchus pacificus]|nr:hypothetical protein PRIPAC_86363 [Pristionchus pacificus]
MLTAPFFVSEFELFATYPRRESCSSSFIFAGKMVYPEGGKIKEMRQKAFNLSCEDDIGSVLQKSVDLIRELTKSQADLEKVSIATSSLQPERILVEEADMNRELPLRNFAYTISSSIETTTEWIFGREKTRVSQIEQQQKLEMMVKRIHSDVDELEDASTLGDSLRKKDELIFEQSKGSSCIDGNKNDRKVEEDSEESESNIVKMKENWPASPKKNVSREKMKTQIRYPKKQVTCKICNKHFKGSQCLKEHMRVHETDEEARKPYKCDICGKAYTQRFNLNKHIRSHSSQFNIFLKLINYNVL